MKATDGELVAAATLASAILGHCAESMSKDRAKVAKDVKESFLDVLEMIQAVCPAERNNLTEILQAVRVEDTD